MTSDRVANECPVTLSWENKDTGRINIKSDVKNLDITGINYNTKVNKRGLTI
jgi:hypothetical protein